jgi:YesN/AraC family two-component response regulator
MEIKQVAAAVGYEDALYFSRLFKKETGRNPSTFRDSMARP